VASDDASRIRLRFRRPAAPCTHVGDRHHQAARLKEERVPDVPDEITEKEKRPREVAFMDVTLGFAPSVRLPVIQTTFPS
jgi:hypothetical protein